MNQFVIAFLGLFFITTLTYSQEPADEKRLDEIAERGAHVMPFDLEKTLHIFSKTNHGGIQQVIVKDKSDTEQINLIRSHLSKIAAEFKQSNFSNPEKIHGKNMPGLADLKAAKDGQIKISYKELPDGAEITYSTEIQKLKSAIHQWFEAQLSDHARHAVPRHEHNSEHHH